jgi:WD40 repeat protein
VADVATRLLRVKARTLRKFRGNTIFRSQFKAQSLVLLLALILSLVLAACSESTPTSSISTPAPSAPAITETTTPGNTIPAPSTYGPAVQASQVAAAEATEIAQGGFWQLPAGAIEISGTPTPTPTPLPSPLGNVSVANWTQLPAPDPAPSQARLIGQIIGQVPASATTGASKTPGAKAPFTALAVSPDNTVIAVADREQVWLCDATTGKILQQLYTTTQPGYTGRPGETEERGAASLSWSPDGKKLAAGTWHGEVILWRWDAPTKQMRSGRNRLQPYAGASYFGDAVEVKFGPDSNALAGFSSSGSITVWDSETLQTRSTFYSPYAGYLSWSPDGKKIVDEYLIVHYMESGQSLYPGEKAIDSDEQPQGVAWSPDGKQIAVSADGFELGLVEAPPVTSKPTWIEAELNKIAPPRTAPGPAYDHYREGRRVAWSPDGRWVAVANMPGAGKVSIWDNTGQKLFTLSSGTDILTSLIWPTNAVMMTAGNDGIARLWQLLPATPPTTPTPIS